MIEQMSKLKPLFPKQKTQRQLARITQNELKKRIEIHDKMEAMGDGLILTVDALKNLLRNTTLDDDHKRWQVRKFCDGLCASAQLCQEARASLIRYVEAVTGIETGFLY